MKVETSPTQSRSRFGFAIFLVVLFIVSIGALIHYSAGTRIIRSGQYGSFQIGEDRQSALAKVERMGIKYVEPLPYESIWLERPSEQQIARLDPYNGITALVGRPYGSPLHIEFLNGMVSKTWPEMKVGGNESPSVQEDIRATAELQSRLAMGLPRPEAIRDMLALGQSHPIYVSNFVVGEQEWRMSFKGTMTDSARDLLLRSDAWKFDGLEDEVWYNPYYSQVKLFFKNGKLERIEHWVFPIELP